MAPNSPTARQSEWGPDPRWGPSATSSMVGVSGAQPGPEAGGASTSGANDGGGSASASLSADASGVTEDVLGRARTVMRRIVSNRSNPDPCHLHCLAAILEQEELRFEQQGGHTNNSRSSHNIGRLVSILRDDDEFFEMLSTSFLVESTYSPKLRAAAARLLYSCISGWVYPHDFEEAVVNKIKEWVVEDILQEGTSHRSSRRKTTSNVEDVDREILRTYATGLLALALAGTDIIDEVLGSGMVSKLMHYLRVQVLGHEAVEPPSSDNRSNAGVGAARGRDEGRGRVRPPLDDGWLPDRAVVENPANEPLFQEPSSDVTADGNGERNDDMNNLADQHPVDAISSGLGTSEAKMGVHDSTEDADIITEDKRRRKDRRDGKNRGLDWSRIHRDVETEEPGRVEAARRWGDSRDRLGGRSRGKGRAGDVSSETVQQSPGARVVSQSQRALQDRSGCSDSVTDIDMDAALIDSDAGLFDAHKRYEDNSRSLVIGSLDLSAVVREASSAAEAEARAAQAPPEAVNAAGDAAAELVRFAATEALGETNDVEAALAAAEAAAASVVDAGRATAVSSAPTTSGDTFVESNLGQKATKEHLCDLDTQKGDCQMDIEVLAFLRQRFCVQCLEKMGEYVEVLGPILHEKGVDVCLALLERGAKDSLSVRDMGMLTDVLKLICAFSAHRKFAALFVDRGGVQKLLATPRVPQTLSGISLCFSALASLQGVVMERVCALPTATVQEIVALALHLLGSNQDPARRHAAVFFGAAFVFRAVLDAFDSQDGLRKFLNVLGNAAMLRTGGVSAAPGTSSISAGSRSDRGSAAEVLTSSGKHIAFQTCVALRQYFRSHFVLVVESLRPSKGHRTGSRGAANSRAVYKPLDLSNEAIESLITQLQRDRKLGPAFVRCKWIALEKFMDLMGHITLLELTQFWQAAPGERYLNDIARHALDVLQLVTLMPLTRRHVVGATLWNERSGMAVILEAASGAAFGDPEVLQVALMVLVNLVCPPPSLCSRPLAPSTPAGQQGQSGGAGSQPGSGVGPSGVNGEGRERAFKDPTLERIMMQTPSAGTPGSAVVGERRISLGPGAGGSGMAAFIEHGYRVAREAVRSNNGIRVLLHLLYPRVVYPATTLDRIRALACRVLLGLARDDTIAHILTKLQVGKILSELLRDGSAGGRDAGSAISGEQGRWQAELSRVALDLIAIVTNAGRASTVAASEAAAPTLRRIERAAIAVATPISYHSRELLQLIHEHLKASGLVDSASALMKEAQLTPLPSSLAPGALNFRVSPSEDKMDSMQWPSGRVRGGFLNSSYPQLVRERESNTAVNSGTGCRKTPGFSAGLGGSSATPGKKLQAGKDGRLHGSRDQEVHNSTGPSKINNAESENVFKTPSRGLSLKRKANDKELSTMSPNKRVALADPAFPSLPPSAFYTPAQSRLRSNFPLDGSYPTPMTPISSQDGLPRPVLFGTAEKAEAASWPNDTTYAIEQLSSHALHMHGSSLSQGPHFPNSVLLPDTRACPSDRATLDSLVVQYLKHQHRQCPAPITTLPPLSLLHPHMCPEPSRGLDAPLNIAGRLAAREICPPHGGLHGRKRDRHFVYSRFRPLRTCRDDAGALLTTTTFLGRAAYLAAGSHVGDIRVFDSSSGNTLEIQTCHTSPITLLQCAPRELSTGAEVLTSHPSYLLLSSTAYDTRLWDSSALSSGPLHAFDSCKAARFNHSGTRFGGIEPTQKEVLLYDVSTGKLEQRLTDSVVGALRSHNQAYVHFSPTDTLVLWNGVLWDHRIPRSIHKFDQFTDYGGGGFHPAGNEVIINSEVWDLRSYKLLRSVPALDQTAINFNTTADVIYAYLRRSSDDIMAALNSKRSRHELFSSFRTLDAVDYSDIATTSVDRCVLDLATESTDSFIAVVGLDATDQMESVVRLYEVGRRRPTDDDSDPDDGGESEEEEESEGEDEDEDGDLHGDDSDIDLGSTGDGSGDDADFGSTDEDMSDRLTGDILELISDEDEDDHSRGGFSSGDESEGDFDVYAEGIR